MREFFEIPEKDPKYEKWIKKNVGDPRHRCAEYTLEMQEVFPELKRIRGHYYAEREYPHWWLEDVDGNIIDPTVEQFISADGVYIPWDESQPEPIGRCLNCGELTYESSLNYNICSDICDMSFRHSLYQ